MLIDAAAPDATVAAIVVALKENAVELRGCERFRARVPDCRPATPEDWDTVAELELYSDREEDSERIRDALNGFLGTLRREDRVLFVRRYWFEDDVSRIADMLGISENHARVRLTRCKKKLKAYLEKEGISI